MSVYSGFMQAAADDGVLALDDPKTAATQFLGLIKSRGYYPVLFSGVLSTREEMAAIIEDAADMFLAQIRARLAAF